MAEEDELFDKRQSLLDAFGVKPQIETPSSANMPVVSMHGGGMMMPGERMTGAIKVDVPRDEGRVLQRIKQLAAAAGDDWYYRFPVRTKGGGQSYVEGPSIVLANEVARIYGNCTVDARVLDIGTHFMIYAKFVDLENGYTLTRPFQQRKSQKTMGADEDRQQDIALSIGVSKAIRNVIDNALQTFTQFAFKEAKDSLKNKIEGDLAGFREKTLKRLRDQGVDLKRIDAAVGRASKEWLAPDLAFVIASMKSVNDGMASFDETFPPIGGEKEKETQPPQQGRLDDFAGREPSPQSAPPPSEAPPHSGPPPSGAPRR